MRTTEQRHRARRVLTGAVAIGLLAASSVGCGDDAAASDAEFRLPEAAPSGIAVIADDADPDEAPVADPEPAGDEPEPEPEPVAVDEGPARFPADVPGIELLTAAAGQGPWPELAWEAVPDAVRYSVTLFAGPGEGAYWAWRGSETAVVVGGSAQRTAGGPQVQPGMTWSVVAFAADGSLVAQSGERPIGP